MSLSPEAVIAELDSWIHIDVSDRDRYIALVQERGEGALYKSEYPEHITSSLFVLSPDCSQILLAFHKKVGAWLQFGGHLERDDASLLDAALREGHEESGLEEFLRAFPEPCDFDIHALGSGFKGVCAEHWDLGFVAIADTDAAFAASPESSDVRWFPVSELPDGTAENLAPRVQAAVQRIMSSR